MTFSTRRKAFGATALVLALAVAQLTILRGYAEATLSTTPPMVPQQMLARITTTGNRPISINGSTAASGDSVATNAVIETPPGVAATIDLGPLGKFDLPPGTKIMLEFDENCTDPENNPATDDPNDRRCKARATVISGCVTGTAGKKGSRIEIATQQQGLVTDNEKEKKKQGGLITGCAPGSPAVPIVLGGGLGKPGLIALLTAAAVIPPAVILATGGDDPSPLAP